MNKALLLCPLLWLSGCGYGPGDYVIFRVATSDAELSSDCDVDSDGDSNTLKEGSTVMVFFVDGGDGAVPYLDLGGSALEGEATDDGYTFSGKVVEVDDQGDAVFTTTLDIKVDMTVDGDTVNLTSVAKTSFTCSGECMGFDPYTCTATSTAVGVEVDEAVSVPIEGEPQNP